MINTGPDEPFGGFPTTPADPGTTGQVMEFVVDDTITGGSQTDPAGTSPATDPWNLVLNAEPPLGKTVASRNVSLNEEMSTRICWDPESSIPCHPLFLPGSPRLRPQKSVRCSKPAPNPPARRPPSWGWWT